MNPEEIGGKLVSESAARYCDIQSSLNAGEELYKIDLDDLNFVDSDLAELFVQLCKANVYTLEKLFTRKEGYSKRAENKDIWKEWDEKVHAAHPTITKKANLRRLAENLFIEEFPLPSHAPKVFQFSDDISTQWSDGTLLALLSVPNSVCIELFIRSFAQCWFDCYEDGLQFSIPRMKGEMRTMTCLPRPIRELMAGIFPTKSNYFVNNGDQARSPSLLLLQHNASTSDMSVLERVRVWNQLANTSKTDFPRAVETPILPAIMRKDLEFSSSSTAPQSTIVARDYYRFSGYGANHESIKSLNPNAEAWWLSFGFTPTFHHEGELEYRQLADLSSSVDSTSSSGSIKLHRAHAITENTDYFDVYTTLLMYLSQVFLGATSQDRTAAYRCFKELFLAFKRLAPSRIEVILPLVAEFYEYIKLFSVIRSVIGCSKCMPGSPDDIFTEIVSGRVGFFNYMCRSKQILNELICSETYYDAMYDMVRQDQYVPSGYGKNGVFTSHLMGTLSVLGRLYFGPDWKLSFHRDVQDDVAPSEIERDVLSGKIQTEKFY